MTIAFFNAKRQRRRCAKKIFSPWRLCVFASLRLVDLVETRSPRRGVCACLWLLVSVLHFHGAVSLPAETLDIYWIDSEGGGSTLIKTPAGESVLIDSGNPGGRDSERIFKVASDQARLKQID